MKDDESQQAGIALVTGGSRGIGRAVAEALLDNGWTVCLCSRSRGSVEDAVTTLDARYPGLVTGEAVDVRDAGAVQAFADRVESEQGRIDCLVNNAGLGIFRSVDELSVEDWDTVLRTNLDGAFYAIRAVAPGMRRRGSGWIFNIASIASRNPIAGGAAYNASKFGLLGLSDAAMLDLRSYGVRVSAILPGSVDTDFSSGQGDDSWKLRGEDVARAVMDMLRYPARALPSRIELRPSQPPTK